ncbi:MAG TPA: hypothetical protein VN366_10385 [Feifaniaceae bacterium]|nr:hypothetical protein [Feifaniaceae bacterium]
MDKELISYLRTEAGISAAFNFFINGMLAALIHHKADWVPADAVSLAIDLALTCVFICTIGALFCAASLRRAKAGGVCAGQNPLIRRLGRLFRRPALFGLLLGALTAAALFALAAPIFTLLGIRAVSFSVYIALKTVFCALLGYFATLASLHAGLCREKAEG